MVPNSVVLGAAVVPLREPEPVDFKARLRPGVEPSYIQKLLEDSVSTPTRKPPHVGLEEVDADEVVVRIAATPESAAEGPKLADEILAAVSRITDGAEPTATRGDGQRDPSEQPYAGGQPGDASRRSSARALPRYRSA